MKPRCPSALEHVILSTAAAPNRAALSADSGQWEVAVADASIDDPQARPRREDLPDAADAAMARAARGAGPQDERDPRYHVGAADWVVGGRGLLLVERVAAENFGDRYVLSTQVTPRRGVAGRGSRRRSTRYQS